MPQRPTRVMHEVELPNTPTWTSYRDARRKVGSQSETPSYTVTKDLTIQVQGYQRYDPKHQVTAVHSYQSKFEWIHQTLTSLHESKHKRGTVMDIRCNAGLTSLLAQEVKYSEVYSLDHNEESILMLKDVAQGDDPHTVNHPQVFSFGAELPCKVDVVFVGALNH